MKKMSEIVNELMLTGATRRLEELNKERETLIKIIDRIKGPSLKLNESKPRNKKSGKRMHWTKTPEGRKKMSLVQKKVWRERRAKLT